MQENMEILFIYPWPKKSSDSYFLSKLKWSLFSSLASASDDLVCQTIAAVTPKNHSLKMVDEATEILEHKTKTKLKSIASVELKEVDNKPIYQVKGVREAKLLWIIPVDMAVTVNVDADSETAEIVHTPWWGFLTS